MRNVYGDSVSGTYKPLGTRFFHRLLKLNVFHELTIPDRNLSATSMFLSWVIFCARICLFLGSIAIHNHINSEPTLIRVSSIMYSESYFSLMMIYYWSEIFVSISILQHDFFWLYAKMTTLWQRFLLTIQENTNTYCSQYVLKVFCFWHS